MEEPRDLPGPRDVEPLWRELIGEALRGRRTQEGRRLVDVARRAGISPQYLSEIERGRKDASSEVLAAVAGALDLTVLDLVSVAASGPSASVSARTWTGAVCLAA